MSAILEAYWLLAAKRFVDNVCMTLDKKIMGAVAHKMQGATGTQAPTATHTKRMETRAFMSIFPYDASCSFRRPL